MANSWWIGGSGGGKGGGGGAARVAVEDPDSLRSRQYARVLDLLSEGEIEGLVDGLKTVKLDGTPVLNTDGSSNFPEVTLAFTKGTQDQDYLPAFSNIESEVTVSSEVKASLSVIRRITNPDVDRVRVTISIPQLTNQDTTNGDLHGTSVEIKIDIQYNNAGYSRAVTDVISGKTTSEYQRSYEIPLGGTGPWDIRVMRGTPDSTSVALQNKTFWSSYTEIIDAKMAYPNCALAGLEVNAQYFQSVPQRAYRVRGIKCQIPSNYNPTTRTYNGTWDGTFIVAYTNNPVWCWYDIVTNKRYGLGKFIAASQIDKWTLYSIAQYCDGLVSDGRGGLEPRFTCNLYLQTREEALTVVANMASIFRAMVFWLNGTLVSSADKPTDPVALFTNANVIDGEFVYSGVSKDSIHTVAHVRWNNPDKNYGLDIEPVEDPDSIERYGYNPLQTTAFGCISQGQAHRWGKWALYTERYEAESVTFQTGLDAVSCYPGSIIKTMDRNRAGKRRGGRIKVATTSLITLDSEVDIVGGVSYGLMVIGMDGSVQTGTVSTGAGITDTLTLSTPLTSVPLPDAVWILSASDLEPETWRVLSITEKSDTTAEIMAIAHNPSKFAYIEEGMSLQDKPTTSIDVLAPPKVTNLQATEVFDYAGPDFVMNKVIVSWTGVTGLYRISYKKNQDNWVNLPDTVSPTVELNNLPQGTYQISVSQVNVIGRAGPAETVSVDIDGQAVTSDVPVVRGLEIFGQGGDTNFTGRDCKFAWRRDATRLSYDIGSEPDGAGSGTLDVYFKDYLVMIFRTNGTQLREESVTDPFYTYTYEKNFEDNKKIDGQGARRDFMIKVWQRGRRNQVSPVPATLTVSNPQASPPITVDLSSYLRNLYFKYTPPSETDWAGVKIWVSNVQGFTPDSSNLFYQGNETLVVMSVPATGLWYVKYATYDSFGEADPISNVELSENVVSFTDADIANNSITQSKLYQDLSDKIDLIDAPSTTPGSVNARILTVSSSVDGIANQVDQITTTVDGHTSTIQIQATSIGGLNAQYTVKTDVNGYVAGYGLAVDANNATPFSSFLIRADVFAVGSPGAATRVPFSVVGGVVYMDIAMIRVGTITDAYISTLNGGKITADSITVNHLTVNSVNTSKLLDNAVTVLAANLNTTNIALLGYSPTNVVNIGFTSSGSGSMWIRGSMPWKVVLSSPGPVTVVATLLLDGGLIAQTTYHTSAPIVDPAEGASPAVAGGVAMTESLRTISVGAHTFTLQCEIKTSNGGTVFSGLITIIEGKK